MTKEERVTYWRGVIAKHLASGLSAAAFCREQDLNIHQFRWWQRRLKKEHSQSSGVGFLQLVPFSKSQHSGIRIQIKNDVFIEVERGFDPLTLRDVIEAICRGESTQCSR